MGETIQFCGHTDESEQLGLFFIKSYVWYVNVTTWVEQYCSLVFEWKLVARKKTPRAKIIPVSDRSVIDNDGAQANIVAAGGQWKRQQDGEREKKMKKRPRIF